MVKFVVQFIQMQHSSACWAAEALSIVMNCCRLTTRSATVLNDQSILKKIDKFGYSRQLFIFFLRGGGVFYNRGWSHCIWSDGEKTKVHDEPLYTCSWHPAIRITMNQVLSFPWLLDVLKTMSLKWEVTFLMICFTLWALGGCLSDQ